MLRKDVIQVFIIISLAILLGFISFFSYKIFVQKSVWINKESYKFKSTTLELDSTKSKTTKDIKLNINPEEINNFLTWANKWFLKNIKAKWIFVYGYNAYTGKYSTKNNMIRQLMASRLLAEMAFKDKNLLDIHQKNLDFIFSHWYKEEKGLGYIYYNNKSKLWAIAMALRTLVYSPYFDKYKNQAKRLADTILSLQNKNGSLRAWYIEPNYSYDEDYLLTFYSGEAILSLIEYASKTGDKKYLDSAILSQNFYLEKYVNNLEKNYYPAYVPWHTMSLNKLYYITKNKKYVDAIFVLNDKLLEIQDIGKDKRFRWRFYNPLFSQYGSPHSSSDGIYTEWLAYAWEIAREVGDETHIKKYEQALKLAVDNLVNLQYTEKDSNLKFYPILQWAVRIKIWDRSIRIDTTQHAIDAFRKLKSLLN